MTECKSTFEVKEEAGEPTATQVQGQDPQNIVQNRNFDEESDISLRINALKIKDEDVKSDAHTTKAEKKEEDINIEDELTSQLEAEIEETERRLRLVQRKLRKIKRTRKHLKICTQFKKIQLRLINVIEDLAQSVISSGGNCNGELGLLEATKAEIYNKF